MPIVDPQSVISLIGFVASVFFSLTLFNPLIRSKVHTLMALVLIMSGLTHLFRALSWELNSLLLNQYVQILLSLQPLLSALFIEALSRKNFHYSQKVFFIVLSSVLLYFSFDQGLNNNKVFLISLVSFHFLSLLFYIINMHSGLKQSANVKEANVKICVLFALYIIFFFIGVDWAYKFNYISFRLYPLSLPILMYYLSSVIYSAGETDWAKVSSRLFGLALISAALSLIIYYTTEDSLKNTIYLGMINFSLLTCVFALYNQRHYESEPLFEKSKDLFDWKNKNISEIEFLKEINKRPEFHHISLVKETFIKKESLTSIYEIDELGYNVLSKQDVLNKKKKNQATNSCDALLYLFEVTDTEFIISVPHTKNLLAIKYVSTSAPYIYSDFFHGIAQKMSIYHLSKNEEPA